MVLFLSGPKNFSRDFFFCHRESQVGSMEKLIAPLICPVLNSHSWRVSTIKILSMFFWYFSQSSFDFIRLYPPDFDSAMTSSQDASMGVTDRLVNHKAPMVMQIIINAVGFFLIVFTLFSSTVNNLKPQTNQLRMYRKNSNTIGSGLGNRKTLYIYLDRIAHGKCYLWFYKSIGHFY